MGKTATRAAATVIVDGDAGAGRRTGLGRDEVVATALELVVREGHAALTMRRLAAELDVGTPTIYWHVGSRDELIAAIVRMHSERLAERPVEGDTSRERVLSAAVHLYAGAIEQRPITSLAHQTGTTSLLLHDVEAALVAELEAAGLTGQAGGDALRSILVVITGALVLTLRDPSRLPDGCRPDEVWAASEAAITPDTRAALSAAADYDAITTATLRALVDHLVPAAAPRRRARTTASTGRTARA